MSMSRITNCPVHGKPRRLPSGHLPGDVRGHHALGVVNLLAARFAWRRGVFGLVAATALLLNAGASRAATGWGLSSIFTLDTSGSTNVPSAPSAPTGLAASDGTWTDKVRVSWQGAANASGYSIYRSTSSSTSSAAFIAGSIATNYDDASAAVGQVYYYWVKATNSYGASAFSSPDSGWRSGISSAVSADYDGDRKADPAVYDEATGTWKIKLSSANYYLIITTINGLGGPGYASVSADYDGDHKADPAVYQESTGVWIIVPSSENYTVALVFPQRLGGEGYSGAPADYDGDQLADPGIYQRERGDWKVLMSSADYFLVEVPGLLGGTGYRAVPADYDGDKKGDPAIYGESDGLWAFKISSADYPTIIMTQPLGGSGYIPVPADYDGDGLADPAVKSADGNEWIVMFSTGGYAPVPLAVQFE